MIYKIPDENYQLICEYGAYLSFVHGLVDNHIQGNETFGEVHGIHLISKIN